MRKSETIGIGIQFVVWVLIARGCLPWAHAATVPGLAEAGAPVALPVQDRRVPLQREHAEASQLGRLRAEEVLLEARLTIAKLRAAIAGTRGQVCGARARSPGSGAPRESGAVRNFDLALLPEIRSIRGVGREIRALVQYPDGSRERISTGSILDNGARVVRVGRGGVWVQMLGVLRALSFAGPGDGIQGSEIQPEQALPPMPVLPASRPVRVLDPDGAGSWHSPH